MARMTEEEAAYWDEYYTKNPPKIDPLKKGGHFTRQRDLTEVQDRLSADYLMNRAADTQKAPAIVITETV